MNSSDDIHRMTETIYRNLSEQFNPAVRQILTCAKTYHKALVAASSAARGYIESLGRLGHSCKISCHGGTEDIGEAIFRIAEVQKEIQLKFEDCSKSFFAEVVLPLEQKIDNDFKNSVAEQKKYHVGHKGYCVPYTKAVEAHRKFLKKHNRSRLAFEDEREIPLKRAAERCRDKLDEFRSQGLKLALLEERKCYCFVLARLTSVCSTQLYYHDRGMDLLTGELGHWKQLCSQPNILPRSADALLRIADAGSTTYSMYMGPDSITNSPYRHFTRTSSDSQHSGSPSEYALPTCTSNSSDTLPRSVVNAMSQPPACPPPGPPGSMQVRALYNHSGEQESQLSFSMGDNITLMGESAEGWQFGHNARTGQYGWFPLSFTDSVQTHQQLQTQTPTRYRQRAKSFSELSADARSLSDFSGWAHDMYLPGSHHRPRSLHESSLINTPSLPQLLGQGGHGLDLLPSDPCSAGVPSPAIFTLGSRSQPASRVPSRPSSPPLPPPPPPLLHATASSPSNCIPRDSPSSLTRHPSTRSFHLSETALRQPVSTATPTTPPQSQQPPSFPPPSPVAVTSAQWNVMSQKVASGGGIQAQPHSIQPPVMPHQPLAADTGHYHAPGPPVPQAPPLPPPPPPPLQSDGLLPSVSLKKTKTNDRSAPRIK